MKQPIVLSWSGGKDSTLALHKLLESQNYDVRYLLTTINAGNKRISMHGVHESLLNAQSESLGIPLLKVWIYDSSFEGYERQMTKVLETLRSEDIFTVAFGDIFLEDLRKYREDKLATVGMNAIFPLWGNETNLLLTQFLDLDYQTTICCINNEVLDKSFVGQTLTRELLNSFPANVDPCGENGEYHTFCSQGPIFRNSIQFELGKSVFKSFSINENAQSNQSDTKCSEIGFWFKDLIIKDL